MKKLLIKLIILSVILLGLPFLGVMLAGLPVNRYLEFPPETQYIDHAPFSWIAFTGLTAWVLAWTRFPWFAGFQPHTFTPLCSPSYLS